MLRGARTIIIHNIRNVRYILNMPAVMLTEMSVAHDGFNDQAAAESNHTLVEAVYFSSNFVFEICIGKTMDQAILHDLEYRLHHESLCCHQPTGTGYGPTGVGIDEICHMLV